MNKLALMPVVDRLIPLSPAVMYEKTAAKYLMLGIHEFRELVKKGIIPHRNYPRHRRRIYLKSDLDRYLEELPIGDTIRLSEDSPDSIGTSKGV